MESGNSLSMISLIMHASLPVQLVMALLAGAFLKLKLFGGGQ